MSACKRSKGWEESRVWLQPPVRLVQNVHITQWYGINNKEKQAFKQRRKRTSLLRTECVREAVCTNVEHSHVKCNFHRSIWFNWSIRRDSIIDRPFHLRVFRLGYVSHLNTSHWVYLFIPAAYFILIFIFVTSLRFIFKFLALSKQRNLLWIGRRAL